MRTLRLVLVGMWVLVAVGLWLRPVGGDTAVGPLLALGFAALNLARLRAGRRPRVELRRRPRPAEAEYHPEFDFGGNVGTAHRGADGGPSPPYTGG